MSLPPPDSFERRVYFDEVDESIDGYGWNCVYRDGAIACRYSNLPQALEMAAIDIAADFLRERGINTC